MASRSWRFTLLRMAARCGHAKFQVLNLADEAPLGAMFWNFLSLPPLAIISALICVLDLPLCWLFPCLCVFACEVSSSWNFHLPVSPASSDQMLCIPLLQLSRSVGEEPLLPHRLGEHSSCLHLDLCLTQHRLHHLEPKLLFIYLSLLRNHLLLENKGCLLVLCFWESNTASDMLWALNQCFLSWILLKGRGQAVLGNKTWQLHSASFDLHSILSDGKV